MLAMPSAEGIILNPTKKKSSQWRIGKHLGSGACGSVHLLSSSSSSSTTSSSSWVVKVTPTPAPSKNKSQKRKKTQVEINASLLYYEYTMYCNTLNAMRGRSIPDIPLVGGGGKMPPAYGDVDGYTYLVMERMEAPLFSLIPILLQKPTKKTINLGAIFTSALSLLQTLHITHRLLFVDIKPDNFMLATSTGSKTKPEERLRLLDLGLITSYRDISTNKHRINLHPNAEVVGTPNYASLNVLNGHTCSRRDDLEALGYVLMELYMRVLIYVGVLEGPNGFDVEGEDECVLPWSDGKSDKEILKLKTDAMKRGSVFWGEMLCAGGNEEACEVLEGYFDVVQSLGYTEKPNYDELKAIVEKFVVNVDDAAAAINTGKRKKKVSKKQQEKEIVEEAEVESPAKTSRKGRDKTKAKVTSAEEAPKKKNTKSRKKQSTVAATPKRKTVANDGSDDDDDNYKRDESNVALSLRRSPRFTRQRNNDTTVTYSTSKRSKNRSSARKKKYEEEHFSQDEAESDDELHSEIEVESEEEAKKVEKASPTKKRKSNKNAAVTSSSRRNNNRSSARKIDYQEEHLSEDEHGSEDEYHSAEEDAKNYSEDEVLKSSPTKKRKSPIGQPIITASSSSSSPSHVRKGGKKSSTRKKRSEKDEVIVIDDDDDDTDDNNDTKAETNQSSIIGKRGISRRQYKNDESSDGDLSNDENLSPQLSASKKSTKKKVIGRKKTASKTTSVSSSSIQIIFIGGPHKGETIYLGNGSNDDDNNNPSSYIVGRDPTIPSTAKTKNSNNEKITAALYTMPHDEEASSIHAKIVLQQQSQTKKKSGGGGGGVCTVQITDLKSTNGTYVNGRRLGGGKSSKAFVGDVIKIGLSVLQVKRGC